MKKLSILFAVIFLFTACSADSKPTGYQFPAIPMNSNFEQVKEAIQKQAKSSDAKILSENDTAILVENYPFMGTVAPKLQFLFLENRLIEVRLRFPAKHNKTVQAEMKKTYGETAPQLQRALIPYMILPQEISVPDILDRAYITDETAWVWRSEKSLQELWTDEQKEQFKSNWQENLKHIDKHLREDAESWNTFFEHNWLDSIIATWSTDTEGESEVRFIHFPDRTKDNLTRNLGGAK